MNNQIDWSAASNCHDVTALVPTSNDYISDHSFCYDSDNISDRGHIDLTPWDNDFDSSLKSNSKQVSKTHIFLNLILSCCNLNRFISIRLVFLRILILQTPFQYQISLTFGNESVLIVSFR